MKNPFFKKQRQKLAAFSVFLVHAHTGKLSEL